MGVKEKKNFKGRIIELDFLRGFSILLMFFDHFMYDMAYVMGTVFDSFPGRSSFFLWLVNNAQRYWVSDIRFHIRNIVVFIFLCLIGICCSFSRNNLKRGLKLFIGAMILTGATFVMSLVMQDRDITITFSVLHCAALALFLIGILEKFTKNKWVYWAISIVMIVFGLIFYKDASFESYKNSNFFQMLLDQILGTKQYGADCMPFLLYGGQVFAGVFIGKLFYEKRESLIKKDYSNNVVTFIGRHSLSMYILHQVVIFLLLAIILLCSGYKLGGFF